VYADHVVIICNLNINHQIEEYNKYEIEKEELNLLKQKLYRKFEEG
jgi:hypothetical protein